MTQQGQKSESASGFSKQPTAPAPSKKDYEGTVPLAPASINTADDTTNKSEDEASAYEGGNSRKRKASGQASSGREQPKKGSRSSNRNPNLNQKSKGGKAFQDIHNQDAQLKTALKGML
ncbi:hypothetical protein DL98DRAFT_532312 [Cadophora sp. DSE1049]|nr:hypothetical protein DL98DRAFT_532312 [Cadophora sp. DSE1049]